MIPAIGRLPRESIYRPTLQSRATLSTATATRGFDRVFSQAAQIANSLRPILTRESKKIHYSQIILILKQKPSRTICWALLFYRIFGNIITTYTALGNNRATFYSYLVPLGRYRAENLSLDPTHAVLDNKTSSTPR